MSEDNENEFPVAFAMWFLVYVLAAIFIVADACKGCVVGIDRNARECGERK